MALIMLILLLFFWGSKYASYRSGERRWKEAQDRNSAERAARYASWERRVVDTELEEAVTNGVYQMKDWARAELQEIETQYGIKLNPYKKETVFILLAHKGKIHHSAARTGITSVGAAYSQPARKLRDHQVKILHIIDEELRSHGVPEQMVFRAELDKKLYPLDSHQYRHGKFLWEPIKDTVI